MNIIVSTMGKHLEVGANLIELLKSRITFDKIGFLVANSKFYKSFNRSNSFLKDNNVNIVKEWEYTSTFENAYPNIDRIANYEKQIGDPFLWNALIADRRIFFGRYCKSKQHYNPRFKYSELLTILDQALCKIDKLFQDVSPDIIISFGTSILGDYLIYLFARARKIPYLQLKATKVKNYIALHDTPCGISTHFLNEYANDRSEKDEILQEVKSYMNDVKKIGLVYEGAIFSSRPLLWKRIPRAPLNILKSIYGSLKNFSDPIIRNDCHIPGSFIPSLYYNIFQPVKAWIIEKRLHHTEKFIQFKDLSQLGEFVFFPLHFEPEVSLQVFGRSYQNQIELVRNIAISAPVNTKVLVKEHPRSIGFRPFSYYRKLLEIPNVYLADPFIKANYIVQNSTMVSVIAGSIGLEAAILEKPVITFGEVPYNVLPDSMVRHIMDLSTIGEQIIDLKNNYKYCEKSLEKYVGAFVKGSVPIDLYSVILAKKNRYFEKTENLSDKDYLENSYTKLVEYCLRRFHDIGLSF